MLVIRLLRTGKKNQPFFKVVVTDKRKPPRGGRFVEQLGFVNPLTKEKGLKADRIKHWISKGAQLSDTIHNLLVKEKIIEGKKISLHKKKKGENKKEPAQISPAGETEAGKEAVKQTPVVTKGIKPEETKPEEKKEGLKPIEEKLEEGKSKSEEKPKEEIKPVSDADSGEAKKKLE